MKTLPSWLLLVCLVLAGPAWAQRRPVTPSSSSPASATPGERQINPQQPAAGNAGRTIPTCEEVRRTARFNIYFDKVEIEKLVQTVSDATCRTFILPENVRGRISIIGPENGRVEVNADAFYAAFLSALDANGLAVYQHGQFLKIVDKRSAKQNPIPTIVDPDAPYTANEQMITKLFRIKYVEVEPLRGVLQQLVSKDGDTIPYPPDMLIVNDVGSNVHRLEKLIAQLDTRASSDEMRIIQLQYASAQEVSATVQKLFEAKSARPGQRAGGFQPAQRRNLAQGAPQGQPDIPDDGDSSAGAVTLSQLIPDERTNKLIVVASPAAFERIEQIIREIDVPMLNDGRINVYYLENANAEELASTLQSLAQGTANRPRVPTPQAPGGRTPGGTSTTGAAELFAGEVKISADKGTNALVIVASQSDYRNLLRVIQDLDRPREQVFVEAVIMEVNLDRNAEVGVNLHTGFSLNSSEGRIPGVVGTNNVGQGLPPSINLANLATFGGFLAGLQGPVPTALEKLGIPSFGVVLHAMQQSSDVNVLSTPHILTTDNEEAEITVGQNVPFQSGFTPSALGTGLGTTTGSGLNTSLLAGISGLGSLYAPITRQNVELKLTIKPQINSSDYIRLVITEQTEEIASEDPVLGPTTSKRSAKTTVVAKDQETVVIGGIMQDRTIESVSKVPVLGDIPLIGHLFRETSRRKTKTNLLLFLTPYIIRDASDFRRIFERKMKERQEFVEQFYGQVAGYDVPVDFSRKPGPLARMNQVLLREQQRAENGGPGAPGERIIKPQGQQGTVIPGGYRSSHPAVDEQAEPEVREVPPPADGFDPSGGIEAPAPEMAPPPEASPERIRVLPEAGGENP